MQTCVTLIQYLSDELVRLHQPAGDDRGEAFLVLKLRLSSSLILIQFVWKRKHLLKRIILFNTPENNYYHNHDSINCEENCIHDHSGSSHTNTVILDYR